MENKIILELISKNLEEIKFLFETMLRQEKPDPLLIEITTLKAKTLYQELRLLLPEGSTVETSELDIEKEEETEVEQIEEIAPTHEEQATEISYQETTIIEEVVTIEEKVVQKETILLHIPEEEILDSAQEPPISEEKEPEEEEKIIEEIIEESATEIEMAEVSSENEPIEEQISTEEKGEEEENSETTSEELKDEVDANEEQVELIEIISETIIETTTITETVKESTEKKVFGEQFIKEPSLNDKLASAHSHESRIKAMPIASIKGAIGLNDRFLFTRELFGNDSSRYESTIDHLDQLANLLEAIEYLEKNFQWTRNDASLKFMDLVKRRFEK